MFKIWDATVLSLATTSTDICLVAFSLRKKKERRKKKEEEDKYGPAFRAVLISWPN